MKELRAILLENTDVKDAEKVMQSLTDDAFKKCETAEIVVIHGRVVKNRYGEIGRT